MLVPLILAAAGVILIVVGQRFGDPTPTSSLPPIIVPTPTPVALATPTPAPSGTAVATATAAATAEPTRTPFPDDVVAEQLQIEAVGINVSVTPSDSAATDDFPPDSGAFILQGTSQPGRGSNSYIFAHALEHLFKPLWNVRIGDRVLVRMSNDEVLEYRISEVRPNIPCPEGGSEPHPYPPLTLQRAGPDCDTSWAALGETERLTLQTSQGFNRNWGEFIAIAEPLF